MLFCIFVIGKKSIQGHYMKVLANKNVRNLVIQKGATDKNIVGNRVLYPN